MGDMKNANKILVGNIEEKITLGGRRVQWNGNNRIDI
jgi:hypothetical protein